MIELYINSLGNEMLNCFYQFCVLCVIITYNLKLTKLRIKMSLCLKYNTQLRLQIKVDFGFKYFYLILFFDHMF